MPRVRINCDNVCKALNQSLALLWVFKSIGWVLALWCVWEEWIWDGSARWWFSAEWLRWTVLRTSQASSCRGKTSHIFHCSSVYLKSFPCTEPRSVGDASVCRFRSFQQVMAFLCTAPCAWCSQGLRRIRRQSPFHSISKDIRTPRDPSL